MDAIEGVVSIVNFEDFEKLDLRIARVISAERVDGSVKLLKINLDLGDSNRVILSGIAKYYSPDELKDKQIVIIANLAPRKIMGLESQGMVLSAEDSEGRLSLITVDKFISAGAKLR